MMRVWGPHYEGWDDDFVTCHTEYEFVETPTLQTCLCCGERIQPGDSGSYYVTGQVSHVECSYRSAIGGWGHHEDHDLWCTQRHDPDGGLSYRESALKVWELAQRDGRIYNG